ncbi:MAG: hypothetical protein ACXABI_00360 [Candidatus Hodarchaeales archaeon]|jgi:replication factor A1
MEEQQESQDNEEVEESTEEKQKETETSEESPKETETSEESPKEVESSKESPKETETSEESLKVMKISELSPFDRKLEVVFVVVEKGESRTIVSKKTNEEHNLADITVGDQTGTITCTLWDETIDRVSEGNTYVLKNGYVNVFQSQMRLALGKWGSLEDTDETISLDDVNMDNDRSKEEHEDRRRRRRSFDRGGRGGYGRQSSYGGGGNRSYRGRGNSGYRGRSSDSQERW